MACCQSYPTLGKELLFPHHLWKLYPVITVRKSCHTVLKSDIPLRPTSLLWTHTPTHPHTPMYIQQRKRSKSRRQRPLLFSVSTYILQGEYWMQDVKLLFPLWALVPNDVTTSVTSTPLKITEREDIKDTDFWLERIALKSLLCHFRYCDLGLLLNLSACDSPTIMENNNNGSPPCLWLLQRLNESKYRELFLLVLICNYKT